jgi:hypothetical protein
MQKVESSSLFIRSSKGPGDGAFCLPRRAMPPFWCGVARRTRYGSYFDLGR